MTTHLPHFLPVNEPTEANWKSVLLEPAFVVGACLFWLAVLPVTGVFCAGVALYDKFAALKIGQLRLPDLRRGGANNPLVLRKKSAPQQGIATPASSATRAFQS